MKNNLFEHEELYCIRCEGHEGEGKEPLFVIGTVSKHTVFECGSCETSYSAYINADQVIVMTVNWPLHEVTYEDPKKERT